MHAGEAERSPPFQETAALLRAAGGGVPDSRMEVLSHPLLVFVLNYHARLTVHIVEI